MTMTFSFKLTTSLNKQWVIFSCFECESSECLLMFIFFFFSEPFYYNRMGELSLVLVDAHHIRHCLKKLLKLYSTLCLCFVCFRDFIEKHLLDFTRDNPGVVVYVKPRRHKAPNLAAEYCKLHFLFLHL